MSKVITSFQITESLLAAFDQAARDEGLDRSKVMRRLVEQYVSAIKGGGTAKTGETGTSLSV